MKKRILRTLAVMSVLLSMSAVPAVAESELDQSQTDAQFGLWAMREPVKQTFTAQKTGTLDKVSVNVACCMGPDVVDPTLWAPPPNLYLEIKGTPSDPPAAPVPVVSKYNDLVFAWYDVPLEPAPLVEAGKRYEIVLSTQVVRDNYYLGGATADVYPGGEFSQWVGTDWITRNYYELGFKTHVTPATDAAAPRADVVNPANGKEGAARGTNVKATFSEQMDPATLSASTFRLFKVHTDGTTTRITNAPVTSGPDGLSATLNPYGSSASKLSAKIKYKAVLTTGAKDLAGNALDQNAAAPGNQQKAWYFTTGSM